VLHLKCQLSTDPFEISLNFVDTNQGRLNIEPGGSGGSGDGTNARTFSSSKVFRTYRPSRESASLFGKRTFRSQSTERKVRRSSFRWQRRFGINFQRALWKTSDFHASAGYQFTHRQGERWCRNSCATPTAGPLWTFTARVTTRTSGLLRSIFLACSLPSKLAKRHGNCKNAHWSFQRAFEFLRWTRTIVFLSVPWCLVLLFRAVAVAH